MAARDGEEVVLKNFENKRIKIKKELNLQPRFFT